ncbi:MAG: NAD(P)-dependent glycerol-3-phosphate dehydrogenase [Candidatus Marinimicrobia bacterium]|nr:NAD(P)-dependent glycerol-3-phosphate dehydrogenase [Candidatus Neomarinimicrobiota bacterium]MBL7023491.1 NAD(P)-dependent glycerol-3-phosphate dehydrogenase [Candidatus Neomarinimicrobiota bacterium]MBL7109550.1 NAD(P)-dependent glycerol-3-phosphate dehydrogenase [Candidatus Neomarinimicrobiota bacterium]
MSVTILGAGTWGSALSGVLADNGEEVFLWEPIPEFAQQLAKTRKHPNLEKFSFSNNIKIIQNIEKLPSSEVVILAIPSQYLRIVLNNFQNIDPSTILVSVAKGIEKTTLMRMSEMIKDVTNISEENIVSLSGPSHAEEVSNKLPTAVVSACINIENARVIQQLFSNSYFRVYAGNDIIGVELGGSVKNIIAIAAGICDGVGFGDNTMAALITRGLEEIVRLGVAMGAKRETFSGLSGIGDLFVTANSLHSRNRYVGKRIGEGDTLQTILNEMQMVAEGVETTKSVNDLINSEQIEMPICEQVYQVLFESKDPKKAIFDLMGRELVDEHPC